MNLQAVVLARGVIESVSTESRCTILFVDLDELLDGGFAVALQRHGMRAARAGVSEAAVFVSRHTVAAAVVGLVDAESGARLLRELRRRNPSLRLIAIGRDHSEQMILAAFRAGAIDYLAWPPAADELIQHLLRSRGAVDAIASEASRSLLGNSEDMREIREQIGKVSDSESSVLITGETGTGKELVARLIHSGSARARKPLVCINCAAIPDTLLESELFGHERGAFTGAHATTTGKLESGNGGTVFLDEIGELSPYAQVRLLRVLEEKTVHRLGGRRPIPLNIRVVTATNRDLDQLAMEDKFRKDLYFRLNVGRIHLPPLRERALDIPLLVDHYVSEMNAQFGASVEGVQPELMEHLLGYPWPGNIRELRNLLEAVFISRPASKISFVDLPAWFRKRHPLPTADVSERDRLISALHATNWNKSKAAGRLRWSRMTVYRKMARYGLPGASDRES